MLLAVEIGIAWGADLTADPETWPWEDYTSRWHVPTDVTITGGRSEGALNGESRSLTLALKNGDGLLTPDDPRSALWPNVQLDTPIYWRQDADNGQVELFAGHITSIRPEWPGNSGRMSIVHITARGVLHRLEQGDPPVLSPLSHYMPSTGPLVWWPLEDGVDARLAASGLPDGQPMTVKSGLMDFDTEAPPGATGSAHPDPTGYNQLVGTVVGGSTTAWQCAVRTKAIPEDELPSSGFAFWIPVEVVTTTGRVIRIILQNYDDPGNPIFGVAIYASELATADMGYAALLGTAVDTNWHLCQFTAEQVGGTVNLVLYVDGQQVASNTISTTLGAPLLLRSISAFRGPDEAYQPSNGFREVWVQGISLHNGTAVVDQWAATQGWPGEDAAARIARVSAEAGIPATVTTGEDDEPARPLGPQPAGTTVAILRDAEAGGGGRLAESGWGVRYLTAGALYNQPVTVVVDGAVRELGDFQPILDTQRYRNQWTISRPSGSSATVSLPDPRRMVWADSATVNVPDERLADAAGWWTHRSAWPGQRYSAISINLHTSPDLILWVEDVGDGSRYQVVNPPRQHAQSPVDQLVDGWTHTIRGRRWWQMQIGGSPAGPYDVAVADGPARCPADGTVTEVDLAASELDLELEWSSPTANGPWISGATGGLPEFPMLVVLGDPLGRVGEVVEVDEIEPEVGGVQVVHLSARAVNGVLRAWPAGTPVQVQYPAIAPY